MKSPFVEFSNLQTFITETRITYQFSLCSCSAQLWVILGLSDWGVCWLQRIAINYSGVFLLLLSPDNRYFLTGSDRRRFDYVRSRNFRVLVTAPLNLDSFFFNELCHFSHSNVSFQRQIYDGSNLLSESKLFIFIAIEAISWIRFYHLIGL